MWPRPFYSIGILLHAQEGGTFPFLGCCFAYATHRHFLTAAHCLGKLNPSDVRVILPLVEQDDLGVVVDIVRHPEADLAVLVTQREAPELVPFLGVTALRSYGESVQALGYPEETEGGKSLPTARLFTGSVQRFLRHDSHMGYRYRAGELSFGSPAGLSGGPVFPTRELERVLGVVAENHDSTTYLRSLSEIQDDQHYYSEKVHEIIRYGIFVDLAPVRDWVEEYCR